jgi:hypothetical protein
LSEETEEKRPAIVDTIQADPNDIVASRVCFSNAPTQINIDQAEFTLFAPLPQFGKNSLYEIIPLGMHVVEGTTHKDADSLPRSRHG